MYNYKIRLTDKDYLIKKDTDQFVYFQAIDDYEAYEKAQDILNNSFYCIGVLSSKSSLGRIIDNKAVGFVDYAILERKM